MPFLSSASGSKNGIFLRSKITPPTVTILPTTNYNQDRATLNAQVDGNGSSTTVVFEYSTSSSFTSYSSITAANSPTISGLSTMWVNVTGLSVNTTYYVRARCTNGGGVVVSSSTNFTTWSLKTATFTSSGSQTIQTVTPTNGTAIVPTIYDILVVGGGGGGSNAGGGGGAVNEKSSQAFSGTSSLVLTVTIGSGGTAVTGGNGGNGGQSKLENTSTFTAVSASGGNGSALDTAGSSGSGKTGGTGVLYEDSDPKSFDSSYTWGGGGGSTGNGGNGYSNPANYTGTAYGGDGGAGTTSSVYSITVGTGGGGGAGGVGSHAQYIGASSASYGKGGNGALRDDFTVVTDATAGQSGYVAFKYYGP